MLVYTGVVWIIKRPVQFNGVTGGLKKPLFWILIRIRLDVSISLQGCRMCLQCCRDIDYAHVTPLLVTAVPDHNDIHVRHSEPIQNIGATTAVTAFPRVWQPSFFFLFLFLLYSARNVSIIKLDRCQLRFSSQDTYSITFFPRIIHTFPSHWNATWLYTDMFI